eukprot:251000_1
MSFDDMNIIQYLYFITFLPALICIPIAIYGNGKLYRHRNDMYMQKRSTVAVFGINISFIGAMISKLLMVIGEVYIDTFFPIALGVGVMSLYLFSFFSNVKNWSIYFKYKWTYYTLRSKWQHIINDKNTVNNDNNWFIKNNQKHSNIAYVYKIFGTYHFIAFLLGIMGAIIRFRFHPIIGQLLMFISFAGPLSFYIYIVCMTPIFDDTFRINWESKMHAKLLIIVLILIASTIASIITNIAIYVMAVTLPLLTIIFFILSYISTFLMIRKNKLKLLPIDSASKDNISACITVDMILQNEHAINLFMEHLSKEFSMEVLLSVIEISQLQMFLLDHINETNEQIEQVKKKMINFPQSVPISAIVRQDIKTDVFSDKSKIIAHDMYIKYIKIGSEFEINISGIERDKIISILDDKEFLMK